MMKPQTLWPLAIRKVSRRSFKKLRILAMLRYFRARRGAELRPEQMVHPRPERRVGPGGPLGST